MNFEVAVGDNIMEFPATLTKCLERWQTACGITKNLLVDFNLVPLI